MAKHTAVISPNLGLYLGQPSVATPARALIDGSNFRIKQGKLTNANLGWTKFSANYTLNGPVTMIANFLPRDQSEHLIYGTLTDIYRLVPGSPDTVVYLTPRYEVGTASASGTAVTGIGTLWVTTPIRAGDEITFGTAGVTDPAATWFVVASVGGETGLTLTASAGTVGAGPYTIRRTFIGQIFDPWSYDIFVDDGTSGDDLFLATNGTDDVFSWNGSDTQVTLHPELLMKCGGILVAFNMALYYNITTSGVSKTTSMVNSDVGKPLAANATGTGLSGEFKLHSGTDKIEVMLPLGDNVVAYSNEHVTPVQFVGDPFVFVFRQAFEDVGPVGPGAIANFGNQHVFVSADAQYEFDGAVLTPVNNHVWREVLRTTDPIRRSRIFTHFDDENGELIWSVPLTTDAEAGDASGQAEFAYTHQYLEDLPPNTADAYSKRYFPFLTTGYYERQTGTTWSSLSQTWASANFSWNDKFFTTNFPQNLAGDKDGEVWIVGDSQTADGSDLLSFVKFGRFALGSGRERGVLSRIYAYTSSGTGTMDIKVYMADSAAEDAPLTETFSFDLTLPQEGHFVSPFRAGRFAEIRFGTTGGLWELNGYDRDVKPGGSR